MPSIYEQEEALFKEWMKHEEWIHQDKDLTSMDKYSIESLFCPDGLHFTGNFSPFSGKLDCDDKQEYLWKKAFLKPIFLCKDYNGLSNGVYEGMDIREETGYYNEKLYYHFYAKYMILLYGITNYDKNRKKFPSFEEAIIKENYWLGDNGFFHAPVVRMNIKKIAGGPKCPDWLLQKYKERDKEYLTRQKHIYKDANVFICCHSGEVLNPIWDLLWEPEWFPDMSQYDSNNDSFWYSPSKKVVIICTPHMSARVAYWEFYKSIPVFEQFLDKNIGFLG